ncbi:HET-domain-containing protein [Podospora aff. communis PSN243]|uniref:HET-domain-containing protein n=1 Tax=Podospora aff. communis PSN243 TaxID=3040156 RepID=A0AAV9G2D1_9PEZI|nr:HET-domain-containing protein [Podospora aff. communis PSN243]
MSTHVRRLARPFCARLTAARAWPCPPRPSRRWQSSTAGDTNAYRYTRLRSASQDGPSVLETFRLVELLPGGPSEPIACRLSEVAIGTRQTYEAISYCWGDPHDKTAIRCNEKQLRIPSTLAAALRGLRLSDRSRHLWADAICINQSDPQDKAMQVPHMRDIYSRSQRTLVWLGTMADADMPRISLVSRACIHLSVPILGLADWRRAPTVGAFNSVTGEARRMNAFSGSLYISLAYILRRPWFRRAWVVQEAAVSRGVTIYFDRVEYDWDEVTGALKFLSSVKFPLAFVPSPQHIAAIDHERDLYRERKSSLPGVLVRHQRCRATDQRDKIFAFAGLISPESAAQDVRITYAPSDSPSVVYRELATKIITRDENLDILSGPPSAKVGVAGLDLPSWVPNWSLEPDLDQGYTWSSGPVTLAGTEDRDGSGQSCCRFSASGGSRYKPDISGDILTAPGRMLGTIVYAGPSFAGVKLPAEVSRFRNIRRGWMQTLRSVLRARDVLASWKTSIGITTNDTYPHTGEKMGDAFWETVCGGEHKTSPTLQKAARSWERLMRRKNLALKGILRSFDILGAFYSTLLFVFVLLKNEPLVEHRLQGRYVMNRKMVRLSSDYIGLAHCAVEEGDAVFLLQGSSVPLVLRKAEKGDMWKLVGDAYVHGVMGGEKWDERECRLVRIS